MNSVAVLEMLNAAIQVVSSLRNLGMTTAELNERIERARRGEEPITPDELRAMTDATQLAITEGRKL